MTMIYDYFRGIESNRAISQMLCVSGHLATRSAALETTL